MVPSRISRVLPLLPCRSAGGARLRRDFPTRSVMRAVHSTLAATLVLVAISPSGATTCTRACRLFRANCTHLQPLKVRLCRASCALDAHPKLCRESCGHSQENVRECRQRGLDCRERCESAVASTCGRGCAADARACLHSEASAARSCLRGCRSQDGGARAECKLPCVYDWEEGTLECVRAAPRCLAAARNAYVACTDACPPRRLSEHYRCRVSCRKDLARARRACLANPESGLFACLADCVPPPLTTSTTSTTSSTTMPPPPQVCDDGIIEAPEVCDRPFTEGGCPSGQICNAACMGCTPCSTPSCACGTPARPSQLAFTTGAPDIGTKACVGGHSPPNTTCTKDQDCAAGDTCSSCPTTDGNVVGTVKDDTGATACNLRSGGLYFGGVGVSVPLPATVPDMGTSLTNIGCCLDATPTAMQLLPTTPTDPGSNLRNCTSGDEIDNTDYPACVGGARDGKPCRAVGDCPGACNGGSQAGRACTTDADCTPSTCGLPGTCTATLTGCLFGPPLPMPNTNAEVVSTCIVNRIAQDASGLTNCMTGDAQLNIRLASDIYLTGDLLPGVTGIQPCPLCTGAPGSETCQGGPNDGQLCAPGSGELGESYPTSHDCPPPSNTFIGILPIPLALSTTAQTKVSAGAQFVFCGFCRNTTPSFEGPPPHPCTSNADCTNPSFPLCAQRDPGAFSVENARTITSTGAAAGDMTDHNPHSSRLVSVFCIPPAFDIVDGAADLPGPGAVALHGTAQLLP